MSVLLNFLHFLYFLDLLTLLLGRGWSPASPQSKNHSCFLHSGNDKQELVCISNLKHVSFINFEISNFVFIYFFLIFIDIDLSKLSCNLVFPHLIFQTNTFLISQKLTISAMFSSSPSSPSLHLTMNSFTPCSE